MKFANRLKKSVADNIRKYIHPADLWFRFGELMDGRTKTSDRTFLYRLCNYIIFTNCLFECLYNNLNLQIIPSQRQLKVNFK